MKYAFATLIVVSSLSLPARADTIFSNLGPGQSYQTNSGYVVTNGSDGFQGVAVSFTTSSAYLSSTFIIPIYPFVGGDVSVDLFSNSNGFPGSQLQTTLLTVSSSGLFSGSLGPLDANTTYWLAVMPTSDMYVAWNMNSTGDTTTPFVFTPDGTNWIADCCSSTRPAFEVDGTPVPEPGTLTLLGLGIAAVATKLRKKI